MADHEVQFEPDTFTERRTTSRVEEHDKNDVPSRWRLSTPVETGYGSSDERETWRMLSETLVRLEHGLGSIEERLLRQSAELFETVDEIGTKIHGIEEKQKRNGEELSRVWQELEESKAQEAVVSPRVTSGSRDCELVSSPPKPTPRRWIYKHDTGTSKAAHAPHDPREERQEDEEDKLVRTRNQREEIAEGRQRDTAYAKPHPEAHTPSTHSKLSIKPTSFDGSTSWEDYKAQFDLIAELNHWDAGTKSIYLAASLKGPAQGILGDLEDAQRRDLPTLTAALNSRFGSENQTEMHRAQLRSRMRRREETLPELAQAIRRLTRQAYPDASASLRETLGRDHFLDALPESDVRWRIYQTRPKSLREALNVAVELEAFQVADKQRRGARAVLPQRKEDLTTDSHSQRPDEGLQKELKDLRGLVNKLLAEKSRTSAPRSRERPRDRRPPAGYSGCHACGALDHFRRDCDVVNNQQLQGNEAQPGLRAEARLPPQMQRGSYSRQ